MSAEVLSLWPWSISEQNKARQILCSLVVCIHLSGSRLLGVPMSLDILLTSGYLFFP
jgi:hypothetical protein